MCLNPIRIINRSRYYSGYGNEAVLLDVPCGKCAECNKHRGAEYNFRAMVEYHDAIACNGYVLFDTLSYRNECLPSVSDYVDVPKRLDFSCFNYEHVKLFLKRLRRSLDYRGYKSIRFFLSSEYGHDDNYVDEHGRVRKGTIRPHYHILVYVYDSSLDPLELSRAISSAWQYGRTDGLPYKNRHYVLNNRVFGSDSNSFKVVNYVTKYVQKSSEFDKIGRTRLDCIVAYYYRDDYNSFEAKKFRRDLARHINQFHRESKGFGSSLLDSLDVELLIRTGHFFVYDNSHQKRELVLSSYYKRKLFYSMVELDGKRFFSLNDDGKRFKFFSRFRAVRYLAMRYDAIKLRYPQLDFDSFDLARYVIFERGRTFSLDDGSWIDESVIEKYKSDSRINAYVSDCDYSQFGSRFVTMLDLGNDVVGYNHPTDFDIVDIHEYAQKSTKYNVEFESILAKISELQKSDNDSIQSAYDVRQHLESSCG